MNNKLYFGDNLDILREYIKDESADLVYLDPPFNSRAQYNLLFERPGDDLASAQAGAFRDTWEWGEEAEASYKEVMQMGGGVARLTDAMRSAMGDSNMMAYMVMMAVRLVELHRVLKPTGSIFLHCDSTASHYLKTLMDAVFGAPNFRNEIFWKRQSAHSDAKTKFPVVTDTILFFSKTKRAPFYPQYGEHDPDYLEKFYRFDDGDGRGRYRLGDMSAPKGGGMAAINKKTGKPNGWHVWKGYQPPESGWRYSPETMARLDREGRIYYPVKVDGSPDYSKRLALKRHLKDQAGNIVTNAWTDIPPLNASGESTGYPTQKPLALLNRIIRATTKEGDVVFDPFCGCGTTIESAEISNRQWIGIDVAVHAIKLIETRLARIPNHKTQYTVDGMPRDFESAVKLAAKDKYQFQWWANYLFNPHALRERERKKGADRGVDGELFFPNGPGRTWGRMLTSVKGGDTVGPAMVRDFRGVLEREKADLGLFICLRKPTREMRKEAASAGFADTAHGDIPRLQIVAIEEFFDGKLPKIPPTEHLPAAALASSRRRSAPKGRRPDPRAPELPLSYVGGKAADLRHLNPAMITDQPEPRQKKMAL